MGSILETLINEDFTLTNSDKRFARTVEHDSLVLDRENDAFFWNSREVFGDALNYLVYVRGKTRFEAKRYLRTVDTDSIAVTVTPVKKKVVAYEPLVDSFFERGKKHRDYWYDVRGYTDQTIDRFRLGFTGEWYTIPIYEDGEFVNFQIRMLEPRRMKQWYRGVGPHSFNFSILSLFNWVVITEGPVDAIMLRQNNIPAVSTTGGSSYWNTNWNCSFVGKKIFIVYDNDKAGRDNAKRLGKMFGEKAKIYTFDKFDDKYDVTDYFKSGRTRDEFISLIEKEGKYYYEF